MAEQSAGSSKKRRVIILAAVVAFIALEVFIGTKGSFDMSAVGKPPEMITHIFGWQVPMGGIAWRTAAMSLLVTLLVCWWAAAATRKMKEVPGRLQATAEMFVQAFLDLCTDTLGSKGRAYLPLVATIFIFVWLSNLFGIVPFLEEPTRNLNTTLGLGIICFVIAHVSSVRSKGVKAYVLDYFEPMIVVKGV